MKTLSIKAFTAIAVCIAVGLLASPFVGQAAIVIGGSTLLSAADANQLESWLGQGPIALQNIFTKTIVNGKTASDFHAAAVGQGATFAVIELLGTQGNTHQIIGGYNPQSWTGNSGYNLAITDAERTAFIFNLTTSVVQREKLIGSPNGSEGIYQTYESPYPPYNGPTFGGGHDLSVNSTLSAGYGNNVSYGSTYGGNNITGNPSTYEDTSLDYGTIEIFTIDFAPVPEPSTYVAGALLLLPFGAQLVRRLRNRKQAA